MNTKTLTVLLFPWLAHGHVSPFLELGHELSKRNFKVYLCSTPANLLSVQKKMGEDFTCIQLVQLHLEVLPNLPSIYHTTNGLPPNLMNTLKAAFDMAESKFSDILQNIKPDLLIYDFMRPWPPEVASRHDIPAVQFIATSSVMTSFMLHVYKHRGITFPFSEIYYHDYESVHADKLKIISTENDLVMESLNKSTDIILIKGVKEIDGKYSDYLSILSGKKIVQVGPLVQLAIRKDEDFETIQWLNKKQPSSTVFVSFGSEYFLSDEDFEEIANGLMMTSVNFIWVIRFPVGKNINVKQKVPIGFFENIGDRGMVIQGWAPQSQILGHSSVGGFVSHCGWNSVNESMYFGIPIIAMPMHLDQPVNARLVKEVGIGVEVVRNQSGKLEREEIVSMIEHVVLMKAGEAVRKKAKELKDIIQKKGDDEIDEAVKELLQVCQNKKYNI